MPDLGHTEKPSHLPRVLIWHMAKPSFVVCQVKDGETTKMKVIELEKLWNFVVDNFLIWIHLGPQINNIHAD